MTTPVCLTGSGEFDPRHGRQFLAYSLLGEGTRLLTEMKVGSNPTRPASFGNGSATHYANQTLHVLADKTFPSSLGNLQQTQLCCMLVRFQHLPSGKFA